MHRSLHSLADILLLGRESGQGGPNLREGGGGQSGLNQHFGSYLCKKDTSISSSTTRVSWVSPPTRRDERIAARRNNSTKYFVGKKSLGERIGPGSLPGTFPHAMTPYLCSSSTQ